MFFLCCIGEVIAIEMT